MSFIRGLIMVTVIFSLTAAELYAGGRRSGHTQQGDATQYRGGLFQRPVGQFTTTGNTTTYQNGLLNRPQMSAATVGDTTTYETRGLLGRRIEVGAANTTGNTTTYTQPGLLGRERAVMTAEQQGDSVIYRDPLGRKVGSATTNSLGEAEYRGPLGRKLYTTRGASADPHRDGFIELHRRQQENANLILDGFFWP